MENPKLTFNRATSQSGFTNASTSASNDKNASVIIREILQNSFDSAIVEAKQDTARVSFSLEYIKKEEIPGINEYEKTIKSIEDIDLTKNEQENDILNIIKNELKKDEIPVLFISDNGVGFDYKKMVAILSDGISDKTDPKNAGGSYGNGHYSSFNISNFRYVMYGGKFKDGSKLCSGQALLRTHKDDDHILRLGTGFYVNNDSPIEVESDNFPKDEHVPKIISNKLNEITESESGAVIAILGFNFFGKKTEESKLIDIISAAVVRNFFVAVKEELLTVEIATNKNIKAIDHKNLDEIMKKTKSISAEPSYKSVENFYNTFVNGESDIVKTQEGNVKVHYQLSESTSLALCRNGMWICDSLPQPLRKGDFVNSNFFNALVLPQKSTPISTLVRRAEGNLHNDLRFKRFSDDKEGKKKRNALSASLKEVKEFLEKKIGKNENNNFTVDIPDLSIEMISEKKNSKDSQKKKANKNKKTKKLKKQTINTLGDDETNATGDTNKSKSTNDNKENNEKRKSGAPFDVKKFLSSHDGDKKIANIHFNTARKASNLLISLRIEDGTDPSCDGISISPRLKILNASNEEKEFKIIDNDTIELGVIEKTDLTDINIEYETNIEGKYAIHYEFLNSSLKKDTND